METLPPAQKDGFEIKKLSEVDVHQCIALVAQTFAEGEPLMRFYLKSADQNQAFARDFCTQAAQQDNSFAVVKGDQIVAFILADDLYSPFTLSEEALNPRMATILSIVELVEHKFSEKHQVSPGQYYHLFLIGTKKGYEGKGLMKWLVQFALDFARRKGFTGSVVEASNFITKKICSGFGFTDFVSVEYETYEHEGIKPFAGITKEDPNNSHITFMVRSL